MSELFLNNICSQATEKELAEFFKELGGVVNICIEPVFDGKRIRKGFVEFETVDIAEKALKLDGKAFAGKQIQIRKFVEAKFERIGIPIFFHSVTKHGYEAVSEYRGIRCYFSTPKYCAVFLDQVITKGVYRWTVEVYYKGRGKSHLEIGTCPSNLLSKASSCDLSWVIGACGLQIAQAEDRSLSCQLAGVRGNVVPIQRKDAAVRENSTVAVEIDAEAGTLLFFVNNILVPHGICNVAAPLYPGLSSHHIPSFTTLSFCRLPKSSSHFSYSSSRSPPPSSSSCSPPPSSSSCSPPSSPSSRSPPASSLMGNAVRFYERMSQALADELALEKEKALKDEKMRLLFTIIAVDSAFEIPNGLSGMCRNVVLRLLCVIGPDGEENIRTVVGMSLDHFGWKSHKYFLSIRKGYIPTHFISRYVEKFEFVHTPKGLRCDMGNHAGYLFQNTPLTQNEGILIWSFQFGYAKSASTAVVKFGVNFTEGQYFGDNGCCFHAYYKRPSFELELHGIKGKLYVVDSKEANICENSILTLEADTHTSTLCLLVDRKRVPYGFTEIPLSAVPTPKLKAQTATPTPAATATGQTKSPLLSYLWVFGSTEIPSFTSISFHRIGLSSARAGAVSPFLSSSSSSSFSSYSTLVRFFKWNI